MKVYVGQYVAETDITHALHEYNKVPFWVNQVLSTAEYHGVNLPECLIICVRTSYKKSGRIGAYLHKSNDDIVKIAALYCYNISLRHKIYAFAHEIGHCDHHTRGVNIQGYDAMEYYANEIAKMLTGLWIDVSKQEGGEKYWTGIY